MDDYLKQALEIVKAQASVRVMTEEEINSMVRSLTLGLRNFDDNTLAEEEPLPHGVTPAKAIKEKSVTCLECGKIFKILTRKHLNTHGLTPDSYREKWGFKKNMPLVCKELQRERRKKMKEMKLWEKRRVVS